MASEGYKETEYGFYIDDFYFDNNGSLVRRYMNIKDAEAYVKELMEQHGDYHKAVKDQKYVTVGSIIACTYGSILAKLTAAQVTEVYVGNGAPVLTCSDCETGINIPTFGTCRCPESMRMGLPGRKAGTWGSANNPSGGMYTPYGYQCIPLIEDEWKQPKSKNLIWKDSTGKYSYALLDIGVLVCRYGGTIGVIEVNTGETKGSDKIADKYYASERLKIRDAANGNQIDGNRAFIAGAIVRVHESKEKLKVEGSDEEWLKIYYDSSKIGWVAMSLLDELPKPITGHSFKYNWDKSPYMSQDFKDKAAGIAKSLNIDTDDLMAIMAFESYFNPAQKNMGGGSATGLVQFMPDTAQDLHTTTTALANMTGVEQLDYVYGYFYPYKGKLTSLSDMYMRVLWPEGIGKSDGDAIFVKGDGRYEANIGLDGSIDGKVDGKITKGEATQKVIDERNNYI